MRDQDIDILARTLYGEARGEFFRPDGGLSALIAVANVVMNRLKRGGWFGQTLSEVCRKPYQFSCWNQGDPNLTVISHVKAGNDEIFDTCLQTAEKVIEGSWPDLTGGATHYHASTLERLPQWAKGKRPTCRVGRHVFYQL